MSSAKRPPVDSHEYYGIKILRDGTWLYRGTPITRLNMVKLFASVLSRDEKGYWLTTPYEKGRIEVEDVPFTAVELKTDSGVLHFRTNLDEWVAADADHPIRIVHDSETQEPSPYILVRKGLEARIARPVYYELAELAVEDTAEKGLFGVWSRNIFFPIGRHDRV